jgi:hypothetical protein
MEKVPSGPEMADTAPPFTAIVAPCNGSPVNLLITLPVTCNVWEKPKRGRKKNSKKVHNKVLLRLISKQLLAAKEIGLVTGIKLFKIAVLLLPGTTSSLRHIQQNMENGPLH